MDTNMKKNNYAEKVRNNKKFRTHKIELDDTVLDDKVALIGETAGRIVKSSKISKVRLIGTSLKTMLAANDVKRITQGKEKEITSVRRRAVVWQPAAVFSKRVIKDTDLLSNVRLFEDGLIKKNDGTVIGLFSPEKINKVIKEQLGVEGRLKWPRRITDLPKIKEYLKIRDYMVEKAYNSFCRSNKVAVEKVEDLWEATPQKEISPISTVFERRDKASFQRYVKILDQRNSHKSTNTSNLIDNL